MSTISFNWHSDAPPKPDVYSTRRNESKYTTLRYWNGSEWFSIECSGGRGGVPFAWPKKSVTPKPEWTRYYKSPHLRKISVGQEAIQWGEPYRVFDDRETLAYLVRSGVLPSGWRTDYQEVMRAEVKK